MARTKSFSMRKPIYLLSILSVVLFACSKSSTNNNDSNTGLSTSPETKQQYNNTTFGVFKGVIIGSSGTIIFKINNGDNVVKGYLSISTTLFSDDTQKDTLTTTAIITLGQPLSNVLFTGRISSMRVSANADGSNASLTDIQINGHNNVTGFIIHENSTKQILCYEGTFTGSVSGIINITRVGLTGGDTTYFLAKVQSLNDTTLYRGWGWSATIADSVRGKLYMPGQVLQFEKVDGKFNDSTNTFNGVWKSEWYGFGQFTSKRTY